MSKNFILNKKFLNDSILFICLPSPLKGVNGEDLIYKMGFSREKTKEGGVITVLDWRQGKLTE